MSTVNSTTPFAIPLNIKAKSIKVSLEVTPIPKGWNLLDLSLLIPTIKTGNPSYISL